MIKTFMFARFRSPALFYWAVFLFWFKKKDGSKKKKEQINRTGSFGKGRGKKDLVNLLMAGTGFMKGEIFLIEHIVAVEMREVDGLANFPPFECLTTHSYNGV